LIAAPGAAKAGTEVYLASAAARSALVPADVAAELGAVDDPLVELDDDDPDDEQPDMTRTTAATPAVHLTIAERNRRLATTHLHAI
jgi:hypothetical protein